MADSNLSELESAIANAPSDVALREVYADRLSALDNWRCEVGGARGFALLALGRRDEAIALFERYAVLPDHAEPVCAYRYAVAELIIGLVTGDKTRLRRAIAKPSDPQALHHAMVNRLSERADNCRPDICGRCCAVVAIAASGALGRLDHAATRMAALADYVAGRLAYHVLDRNWELHAARSLMPAQVSELVANALRVAEWSVTSS